jgi:trehalose 6-phosphate phosphatase
VTGSPPESETTPLVGECLTHIERRLASVERVLLCLDFDGTLAPHVDDPDEATLTDNSRRMLETLCRQSALDIAIVSGRALADLKDRVGIDAFTYAGNHGLESDVWTESEGSTAHPRAKQYRSNIDQICAEFETQLTIPGCRIENKGVTATVHYRNADIEPDEIEERVASVVEQIDGESLQLVPGTEIVEIRPAIEWNKGHAVQQFEKRYQVEYLTIYIGDDTTDEDAFRAIEPDGISIYVGTDGETDASYYVPNVDGVTEFLEWLAETDIDALQRNLDDQK